MRKLAILMLLAVLVSAGCGGDGEPTAPAVGSCCLTNGTCTVTTQADCGGTWTQSGACNPSPCQQPTGSCCALDGSCTVTTQAGCTDTWTEAGVCTPNPCTQPPPGMVRIPAGNVLLGQVGIAEPVHDVYVAGFYIDIYEVSNARYKAFIDASGYRTEEYWNPIGWAWRVAIGRTLPAAWNDHNFHGGGIAGNEQYPVIGVSWFEADAYCRWAGSRLPTEAEWEKAAKGGCETHGDPEQCNDLDTPSYPWGEVITGPQANYRGSGDPYEDNGWTTPVGYYDGSNHGAYQTIDSPSPYGLYDVAGNAWEWTSTEYVGYPYNPNDGREDPPGSATACCRVLRGGTWAYDFNWCALRNSFSPDTRSTFVGFRCARSGWQDPGPCTPNDPWSHVEGRTELRKAEVLTCRRAAEEVKTMRRNGPRE